MADEDDTLENTFSRITDLQKKANIALDRNTKAIQGFQRIFQPIGGYNRAAAGMGSVTEQTTIRLLQEQNNLITQQIKKLDVLSNRFNPAKDSGTGQERGSFGLIFKHITGRFGKIFTPLTKMAQSVANMGSKVWGGLKKSGLMPAMFMGIAAAVGAVMGKVISSSPLLQAMLKLFSMGMTLIFRPIGDFIGGVLRPIMISFIKDVAVPLFQAAKPLVKQGQGIGKLLMGWITDPVKAMVSAITIAMAQFMKPMIGSTIPLVESHAFQQNAATYARRGAGAGEFAKSKSFSIVATDEELGLAGYSQEEIAGFNESVWKTGYDWRKIAKVRENMEIPKSYEQQIDAFGGTRTYNERIFGASDNIDSQRLEDRLGFTREWWEVGLPGMGNRGNPQNKPTETETEAGFWEKWDAFWDQFYAHAEEEDDARDDITDSLDDFGRSWDSFVEYIGDGWDNFGRDVEAWASDIGRGWDDFASNIDAWSISVGVSFNKWVTETATGMSEWLSGISTGFTTWLDELDIFGTRINETSEDWWTKGLKWLGLADEENKEKEKTIDQTKEADKSWVDTLWDMVKGLSLSNMEIKQAFAETATTIDNANKVITEKAIQVNTGSGRFDVATQGGMLSGTSTQDALATLGSGSTGSVGYGGAFTPYASLPGTNFKVSDYDASSISGQMSDSHLGYLEGKKITNVSQAVMTPAQAREIAVAEHGGLLGDPTGKQFMGVTGGLMDVSFRGEKLDPTSPEGIRMQAQFQKQYENAIQNEAQTNFFNKVGDLSKEGAKAYVIAGGGEAGLAAAKIVDERGLDMQTDSGLAVLANYGVKHPMIDQAIVRQANKALKASAVKTTGWSTDSSGTVSASINGVTWSSNIASVMGTNVGGTTTSIGGGISGSSPAGNTGGFKGSRKGNKGGGTGGGSTGGGSTGGGTGGGSKGTGGGKGSTSGGKGGRKGGGGKGTGGGSKGKGSGGGSKGTGGGKGSSRRQFGGIIDEPIIGIGLDTGREWLLGEEGREFVVPEGDYMGGGINVLNINVGNITREADYIKLKPLIQRWILEASSRRGTV